MTPSYCYRIAKYDPQYRDSTGAFVGDDWVSVDQIGEEFGGRALTFERYVDMENRYVHALALFIEEAKVERLQLVDVEYVPDWAQSALGFCSGDWIAPLRALDHCRLLLRGWLSCKLEALDFYCHVGYD